MAGGQEQSMRINERKALDFRYGENPHQRASFYSDGDIPFKMVQGKPLSYNNVIDADAAYRLVCEFSLPTVAIIKHNSPCGAATAENLLTAFERAHASDPMSSFGGVVAANSLIDASVASELLKSYLEVVVVPNVTSEALQVLSKKPSIRVLVVHNLHFMHQKVIRSAFGGLLKQSADYGNEVKLQPVTEKTPTNPAGRFVVCGRSASMLDLMRW